MNVYHLAQQLWHDDCGGIITAEYLMLGSVLTIGTVSGMTAMRDATVEEMRESGNTMRPVREQYTPKNLTGQRATSNTNALNTTASQNQVGCVNGVCP
jgi:hypothetical protein